MNVTQRNDIYLLFLIFLPFFFAGSLAKNIQCFPEERNMRRCSRDLVLVCGHPINKNKKSKEFNNPCSACSNPDIDFYSFGECQFALPNAKFCHPKLHS